MFKSVRLRVLTGVALTFMLWAGRAQAEVYSNVPWYDSRPAYAYIGVVNGYYGPMTVVIWRNGLNDECVMHGIAPGTMNQDLYVNGGYGPDNIWVIPTSMNVWCSDQIFTVYAPNQNGWRIVLNGWHGNDYLYTGIGPSTVNGGDGDDVVRGNCTSGSCYLYGGEGTDKVVFQGSPSVYAYLTGDSGNDCVQSASTVSSSILDCGTGTDTYAGTQRGAFGLNTCETQVTSCY